MELKDTVKGMKYEEWMKQEIAEYENICMKAEELKNITGRRGF